MGPQSVCTFESVLDFTQFCEYTLAEFCLFCLYRNQERCKFDD